MAEHTSLQRAQNAIALITAFLAVPETGCTPAARLMSELVAEEDTVEALLATVTAIAAVIVRDLSAATGRAPEEYLQTLGWAAATLAARDAR
jgi:hypothetical protein